MVIKCLELLKWNNGKVNNRNGIESRHPSTKGQLIWFIFLSIGVVRFWRTTKPLFVNFIFVLNWIYGMDKYLYKTLLSFSNTFGWISFHIWFLHRNLIETIYLYWKYLEAFLFSFFVIHQNYSLSSQSNVSLCKNYIFTILYFIIVCIY